MKQQSRGVAPVAEDDVSILRPFQHKTFSIETGVVTCAIKVSIFTSNSRDSSVRLKNSLAVGNQNECKLFEAIYLLSSAFIVS